jgi:hypothetical protein
LSSLVILITLADENEKPQQRRQMASGRLDCLLSALP